MSDVQLPADFQPLATSSPKKREPRLEEIIKEVKLLDLESETFTEGMENSFPAKEDRVHFYATL